MDGAQVGIFEETHEVGFRGFLKSKDGRSLEAKIRLEILSNLTDETLEGQLADQQVSGLLVATDLAKGDSTRAVTVRLLDSSSSRSGLASSLGGKLLTGSLASGGLTSGLLCAGHGFKSARYAFCEPMWNGSVCFWCYDQGVPGALNTPATPQSSSNSGAVSLRQLFIS
jgi:hypothetical protein